MPFHTINKDITTMDVDAIVNAANTELLMGGGVCGAIFRAAGPGKMQEACGRLAPIRTGEAVITPGFDLPARYVIHTAGPVYHMYSPGKAKELLEACYRNSLGLAKKNGCKSVAFPLISSGIYGYPRQEAIDVAKSAIQKFLKDNDNDMDVWLVSYGA